MQHELVMSRSELGRVPDSAWDDQGTEGSGDLDPTADPLDPMQMAVTDAAAGTPAHRRNLERFGRSDGKDDVDPDVIPDWSLCPESILIDHAMEVDEGNAAIAAKAMRDWSAMKARARIRVVPHKTPRAAA
ncbi:hypothetical protein HY632_04110 [Candidatus Uhrbacteria bacterium]|nr:hypothetical protein [Candidatus Uhrbacteria bacterium]